MSDSTAILDTHIPNLTLLARGKVRDIYAVDEQHLAIVATDRLSAYDVILPDGIAGKGEMLTQIARFWFAKFAQLVPNHLTDLSLSDVTGDSAMTRSLEARTMIVRRLQPLPMEAVARGYLIGSGWRDYLASGEVCGHRLPSGMRQADKLAQPLFTPATKAEVGDHDENISFERLANILGRERAEQVRTLTLEIYAQGVEHALSRGIIIADTKFEFGTDDNDELYLIDEVLTPDSSRFWPLEQYAPGSSPPSFDKQFVRDYLDTLDWNKTAPGPRLPEHILMAPASVIKPR